MRQWAEPDAAVKPFPERSSQNIGTHAAACRPALIPTLWILGTALVAVSPLALRGNSCGHDFDFHLLSWMEAVRAWHTGVWHPHWVHDANYGAGEPRFIFYPPLSWMLGGLLGLSTGWAAAPVLFALLVLSASGGGMFLLSREWVAPETATLAACLYVANPYALFTLYERSAFGELLAGVWLPLVVLFALRRRSSIAALAMAVAAVWLSDAPAAVIASYTLGFLALAMVLAERKAWPAWRVAGGMALGLGLAAFYIVPAAFERSWVEIGQAVMPGMRVEDSFLFEHTADSFHTQVLRTASWLVVSEFAVAAIAGCWALRRRSIPKAGIVLASVLPLVLFMQFSPSAAIWNHLPQLKFVQFPWRWLLLIGVVTCALVGLALGPIDNRAPRRPYRKTLLRWQAAVVGMVIIALVVSASLLFFQPCDDEDAVAAEVAAFHQGQGVEGTDEYTTFGADNSEIQQGLPFVRVLRGPEDDIAASTQTGNPQWSPDKLDAIPANVMVRNVNTEDWTIRIQSNAPGYAVLRLMDYPAWRVTVNERVVRNRPKREDGLMSVPFGAGSNTIAIHWSVTPDILAGSAVSALSLLVLIPLLLGESRQRERQEKCRNPQVS